jgi:hypothetical protein
MLMVDFFEVFMLVRNWIWGLTKLCIVRMHDAEVQYYQEIDC